MRGSNPDVTTTVRLLCPNLQCKTLLSVPGEARGRIVRCRQCGTRIRIPLEQAAKPNPNEASPAAPSAPDATTP